MCGSKHLKEGVFEPSSQHWHMAEVLDIIHLQYLLSDKSVLFLYSDGGPNHYLTSISIQLSLIVLPTVWFGPYLCSQGSPFPVLAQPSRENYVYRQFRTSVYRLNEAADEWQAWSHASCNNASKLRHVGEKKPKIIPAISDYIAPVKILLSSVPQPLKLHDKQFRVFSVAMEDDLKELWCELDSIDKSLVYGGQNCKKCLGKKCLESHPNLVNFIWHCCNARHYSFAIKKCGDPSCPICKPVQIPREMFEKLSYLSYPVPGQDGYYSVS